MSAFSLFREQVISLYREKKNIPDTDGRLTTPSLANLRDYCLVRLSEGLSKSDIQIFSEFFDPYKKSDDLERTIRTFSPEGLKAFQNFINGKTKEPKDLLVKLLAVLIDFQPRPYRFEDWLQQTNNNGGENKIAYATNTNEETSPDININSQSIHPPEEENSSVTRTKQQPEKTNEQPNEEKDKEDHNSETNTQIRGFLSNTDKSKAKTLSIVPWKRKVYIASASVLTAIAATTIYFSMPKDCMCWNGERYIAVDCHDKTQAYQIIGLNTEKLEHFQKITRSDTLSAKDIGRVWYSKIDHEVEFYTGPGHHPIRYNRSLKAVTKHILDTYANSKHKSSNDYDATLK